MIYDISLPLSNNTIVYPGNPEVSITEHHRLPQDSTNISLLTMGSHSGTHVDAPRHVDNDARPVDEVSLERFFGMCRVLDMTHCKDAVRIEDFEQKGGVRADERILVKTQNSLLGFETFRDDYVYLDGDAADFLEEKGIALFGIDYLSVKQRGSKDVRPHTSLLNNEIPVIEGIDLREVPEGDYLLSAAPLKISGIDGAPLRAILVTTDHLAS